MSERVLLMLKNKKIILFIISILVFTFLISACSPGRRKPGEQNGNGEFATLNFLYIWPEHQVAMNKAINDFMDENIGITVEASVVPYSEVDKVLQTQIAGNTVPDVYFQWTHQMQQWVELDAALDLTPYVEEDPQWLDRFANTASWELAKFNGKYYNMPFRTTAFVIGYNKPMFEENGWSVPESIQDFEILMEQILNKGITPFAAFGRPAGGTIAQIRGIFITYLNIQSGIVDDPNYSTGRLKPDGDYTNAIAATEKAKIWFKKGWLGANAMGMSREDAQNSFINERAAMSLFNNNEIGVLSKGLGKEIGLFAFPSPRGVQEKYVFGGFDGFCISSSTDYPDAAVKFLKWLSSDKMQQEWADTEKSIMVNKNVEYEEENFQVLSDIIQYAGMYDSVNDFSYGEYANLIQDLTSQFFQQDSMTAEEFIIRAEDLARRAIEAAGKSYIETSYTKKEIDDSWLYTVK